MARETSEVKIKYRSAVKKTWDKDGKQFAEYEHDFVNASTKSTKRYNSAMCLLMGISGCPHHLIDWISGSTGDQGFVNNNSITRESFISFHAKHSKGNNKTYGHDAVNKAFKRLSDDGFLIPISKGVYKVNPMMYFAGDEDDRIKSIRMMMEFKSGIDTKIIMEVNKK